MLPAVVTGRAKRLERARPEQSHISSMRNDVITHFGSLDDFILEAHRAKRVKAKLSLAQRLPSGSAIPGSPRCVVALAISVALALCLRALCGWLE